MFFVGGFISVKTRAFLLYFIFRLQVPRFFILFFAIIRALFIFRRI